MVWSRMCGDLQACARGHGRCSSQLSKHGDGLGTACLRPALTPTWPKQLRHCRGIETPPLRRTIPALCL